MLDTLITSKTRIKLLLKFFLNPNLNGYLRGLEHEFEEGSNAIRLELNRFEEAGLLSTSTKGNKKLFQANQEHPMYQDLNILIRKYTGIDKIVKWLAEQSGDLDTVYLGGKLATGLDSNQIDLIILGDNLNKDFVQKFADKAENLIHKKVKWVSFSKDQFERKKAEFDNLLLIWTKA